MELHLVKRVMDLNGQQDISFVPCWPIDIKRSEKIPLNKPFAVETKVQRDYKANSKLWALCSYFVANLPERYFTNIYNDLNPMFPTAQGLYEWLKIRVGYCDVYEMEGVVYKVPKSSSFSTEKDELNYLEKFNKPAIRELARMSDMEIYDLTQASIQWRKNKTHQPFSYEGDQENK